MRENLMISAMRAGLLAYLVSASISSGAWPAERPSDDEIRQALVGSWIVPRDSSDYGGKPGREVFRPDGTSTLYVYQDQSCTVLAQQVEVKWIAKNGVLTTILPNDRQLRDEIVSIGMRMILHSLDDGTTYARVKSTACIETSL